VSKNSYTILDKIKMENMQLPPLMQPLQFPVPLDECEQLWNDLKSKLRALNTGALNNQERADIKAQARQLYRNYIQCMREKRPGSIRKHLSVIQEAAIDYVAGGSRRTCTRRQRSRRSRSAHRRRT
jgi:hypothetical protein